nr:MAG TPA: hypothetical protein [Caudoviricetes sp.]
MFRIHGLFLLFSNTKLSRFLMILITSFQFVVFLTPLQEMKMRYFR